MQRLMIFTIIFYLFAFILQYNRVYKNIKLSIVIPFFLVLPALIMHAILLFHWIDQGSLQNLTFFNVTSQIIWLIAVLLCFFSFIKPIDNLLLIIFPLAAFSVLLAALFPSINMMDTKAVPGKLLHILLFFVVISVFCTAALQAILLWWQTKLLHQNKTGGMLRVLPPLETMENLLFQIIFVGFSLFTLALFASILFFPSSYNVKLLPHICMALLTWVLFALLIASRKLFGWRGYQAIAWTLAGVSLILFLGSYLF